MIVRLTTLLLLAPVGVASAREPASPGFDCARAASHAETTICADSALAGADAELAESYGRLLRHTSASARAVVRAGQRAWLARRDDCPDAACLRVRYDTRDTELRNALDTRDRVLRRGLARIGQCERTTIDTIGPRLGAPDARRRYQRPVASGTSVAFMNGVYQVSYDFVAAVARARIGDPARVCLVSIPSHCPPGDDRGRWYAVTDLRTGARWKMPDAEHQCGGA